MSYPLRVQNEFKMSSMAFGMVPSTKPEMAITRQARGFGILGTLRRAGPRGLGPRL